MTGRHAAGRADRQLITWTEGALRPPVPLAPILRLAYLLDNP
ncbi:MAG: hypothetical protein SYR96_07110 [Actinomycetota bacterium]|nr:hypothetical protein [Actinomycetota bacterium]